MNTLELDKKLNDLIIRKKTAEAFERFYAEDVVSQENDELERTGRDEWLKERLEAEARMKTYKAKVLSHAANGDTSFAEWFFDIELEGLGEVTLYQVAVRRWKDGRIVHERFYHK